MFQGKKNVPMYFSNIWQAGRPTKSENKSHGILCTRAQKYTKLKHGQGKSHTIRSRPIVFYAKTLLRLEAKREGEEKGQPVVGISAQSLTKFEAYLHVVGLKSRKYDLQVIKQ